MPEDISPTHFSDETTIAARRVSFGATAEAYDEVRPPWPSDTVRWMLGPVDRPVRVLDLGAGTGLGTRTIAGLGHHVVAVDPSADMLAVLWGVREGLAPEVAARMTARVGTAEPFEDEDSTYDAITCFQAWHWVDTERAEPECARVIVAGGHLSMAWHSWAPDVDWLVDLGKIVDTPEMIADPDPAEQASQARTIKGFEPPQATRFTLEQRLSALDLVRLASTWSPVAVRSDRADVLAEVEDLGRRVAGADATLVFASVTDCYRYRKTE